VALADLPASRRLLLGAFYGALFAFLLIGIGLLSAAFQTAWGVTIDAEGMDEGLVVYVAVFALAGAVMALLWPRNRAPANRYRTSIIGAGIVFGGLLTYQAGPPWGWEPWATTLFLVGSLLFGLAFGYGWTDA
jgi:hypothetical protein